jgi:hypothetical protein
MMSFPNNQNQTVLKPLDIQTTPETVDKTQKNEENLKNNKK